MKNLWIQTEDAFATWIADFTAIAARPMAILEFIQAALVAGVKHRVFEVAEAPLIGYRRDRDGALGDVVGRQLERDRVLDLFGFTGAAMMPGRPRSSTVETTLCYYDHADRVVERVVTDLGAVLESLEPVPNSIWTGFMNHYRSPSFSASIRISGSHGYSVRRTPSATTGECSRTVNWRAGTRPGSTHSSARWARRPDESAAPSVSGPTAPRDQPLTGSMTPVCCSNGCHRRESCPPRRSPPDGADPSPLPRGKAAVRQFNAIRA